MKYKKGLLILGVLIGGFGLIDLGVGAMFFILGLAMGNIEYGLLMWGDFQFSYFPTALISAIFIVIYAKHSAKGGNKHGRN